MCGIVRGRTAKDKEEEQQEVLEDEPYGAEEADFDVEYERAVKDLRYIFDRSSIDVR